MSGDPYNPDYDYVAYLDEAGETGLKNVLGVDSHGSSEWFVLSLVLVPKSEEPNLAQWVSEMLAATRSRQLRDLHFKNLPDHAKRAVTANLAGRPVRGFVVCANKKNMRRYHNPRAAVMGVNDWFYCWITRIALERASHFVWRRSMQKHHEPRRLKVIFSERGGLKVGQIGAYYQWIKPQSLNGTLYIPWGDIEWDCVHPLLLDKDFHRNLHGLKLADILASAFFAACDNKQSGPCEPTYASLLKPIMANYPHTSAGRYSGYGVKLLPTWSKAQLTIDQQKVFRGYGYPLQLWQEGRHWALPPPPWERVGDRPA